jgi:hypothetical protein
VSAQGVTFAFLLACAAGMVLAERRRLEPPLWVSLVVAVIVRVLVAVLAQGHTPHDVMSYFHTTATLVAHGRDPLTEMPRYNWNFLPVMPYVWSQLLHLHFSWEVTDKIPAIGADVLTTALVAELAVTRRLLRAFQYALCPLALLVTSWHGQVEPIVLALGLLALVVVARKRDFLAGALVGLAVAIKT